MASRTVSPEAGAEEKGPRKCAWPSCPVVFTAKTRVNKYCSPRCKSRGQAYKGVLRR